MENTVEKRLSRSQVPEELTWNLVDLFPSEQAWETELRVIEKEIPQFDQFKGILHTDSKTFLNCLSAQEQLSMKMIKAWTYASLKQSADGSDPVNQANSARLSALRTKSIAPYRLLTPRSLRLKMDYLISTLKKSLCLKHFEKP